MGRVTRIVFALACALAALPLLGGCAKVEAMTYRPSLAAAEATVTSAPKLPASLTKVAAKKKAPVPKPAAAAVRRRAGGLTPEQMLAIILERQRQIAEQQAIDRAKAGAPWGTND